MFPFYRKYKNNTSWFRVNNAESFDEVKIIAGKYYHFHFAATILPDRNFIKDLQDDYSDCCEECTESEFLKVLGHSSPSKT